MRNSIEIGVIRTIKNGVVQSIPIEAHPGYGITCQVLGTTNGYIGVVTQQIALQKERLMELRRECHEHTWDIEIELDGELLDIENLDKATIADKLKTLYLQMNGKK
jgi:hypothetical protein